MGKFKKLMLALVCLAVIGALVVGCGGSSKSNNNGGSKLPSPTEGEMVIRINAGINIYYISLFGDR